MNRLSLLAGMLAATTAACAPTLPPRAPQLVQGEPRQCFFASTVSSFRQAGDRSVNLRAGRDVYQLELLGSCPDIRRAERVLLDSRAGGSSVCAGLDVELIVPTSVGPRRCPGRTLRRLAEAEVRDLPAAQRP